MSTPAQRKKERKIAERNFPYELMIGYAQHGVQGVEGKLADRGYTIRTEPLHQNIKTNMDIS